MNYKFEIRVFYIILFYIFEKIYYSISFWTDLQKKTVYLLHKKGIIYPVKSSDYKIACEFNRNKYFVEG